MVYWYKDTQKFYGMTTTSDENVEVTTFESGKSRYNLKNSTSKKTFSFSFNFENKADEESFWTWYSDILKSRTQTVGLTDLITHEGTTEYRMTSEPSVQDSQYPKEVQITVREE